MTTQTASYPRHRFPAEIIGHAVWLYHVFSLSLRDVELILAERGVVVTHESIGTGAGTASSVSLTVTLPRLINAGFVFRPVRDPVSGFRNLMMAAFIVLVGHGVVQTTGRCARADHLPARPNDRLTREVRRVFRPFAHQRGPRTNGLFCARKPACRTPEVRVLAGPLEPPEPQS